jgi:hypothetical protein
MRSQSDRHCTYTRCDALLANVLSLPARRCRYIVQTAMRSHSPRMTIYESKVTSRNRKCGRHPYLAKVKADPTPSKARCLAGERYRDLPARDLSFPASVRPAAPSERLSTMLLSSSAPPASSRSPQCRPLQKETAHLDTKAAPSRLSSLATPASGRSPPHQLPQ